MHDPLREEIDDLVGQDGLFSRCLVPSEDRKIHGADP
jgi:hypothetical protein